ncbi:hypothetical protein PCK2_000901 [Pneumocystis canis]|nr:hypothetical protein PCK2_000901 [Pneumocystis canis]
METMEGLKFEKKPLGEISQNIESSGVLKAGSGTRDSSSGKLRGRVFKKTHMECEKRENLGEKVWPVDVEEAFMDGMHLNQSKNVRLIYGIAIAHIPKLGRRKIVVGSKPCGRNELIADYIYRRTGKIRTRKQRLKQIMNSIYEISSDSTVELVSELSILSNLLDPYFIDMFKHDLEERIADFVVTEDTDTLVFNAKMLRGFMSMRNLANENNRNPLLSSNMFVIDPIDVRLNLGNISVDSFIDFAILCGTDFCNTIHGLGCFGAFFLIQKYQNIELVLENLSEFRTKDGKQKYIAPENYIQEVQVARKAFMHMPHVRFFDKLTVSDNSWFNITENDWEKLETSVIKKYKLNQLNLLPFSIFNECLDSAIGI